MMGWDVTPGTFALLAELPVERFDGNLTDCPVRLFYAESDDAVISPESISALMRATAAGQLGWVVFPPRGFRL